MVVRIPIYQAERLLRGADSSCWLRRDLVESNSEGRWMLSQRAVRIDGQPTKEETHPREEVAGKTLSVDRRRFNLPTN